MRPINRALESNWRVFWEPKLGNSVTEYEDAFWPASGRGAGLRFAVADGATESSYSGDWASLLVERYGSGATWKPSFIRALPDLQAKWRTDHVGRSHAWYAEAKLRMGAFAAFLGVRLMPRPFGARLHALASGDCELVHIRGETLHCAFPLRRSSEFGFNPLLIGSGTDTIDMRSLIRGRREDVRHGDILVLMSDAIAAWFLREAEHGLCPWRELQAFEADDLMAFQQWADEKRLNHQMRNDDVTMGLVSLE